MYIYTYIYRRLGGNNRRRRTQSGNRFRFVFVSCVRASGRGEAVWACERGVFVNAGGLRSNISFRPGVGLGFLLFVFVGMLMGFKAFSHGLLLCSWAF